MTKEFIDRIATLEADKAALRRMLRRVTAALKDSVGAAHNGEPYTRDKDMDTLEEFAALVAEAEAQTEERT